MIAKFCFIPSPPLPLSSFSWRLCLFPSPFEALGPAVAPLDLSMSKHHPKLERITGEGCNLKATMRLIESAWKGKRYIPRQSTLYSLHCTAFLSLALIQPVEQNRKIIRRHSCFLSFTKARRKAFHLSFIRAKYLNTRAPARIFVLHLCKH